jgi:exopolyphosphatase/guanosine-5'-triphosphate,3'-diphosphate pyrophosphatase
MKNRFASIDIGSNTILMLIADLDKDGKMTIIEDFSEVVGLGKNLSHNKTFDPERKEKAFQVLGQYSDYLKIYKVPTKNVMATATEASRLAQDAKEFFETIKKTLNMNVVVIDAQTEALYSCLGAKVGLSEEQAKKFKSCIVLDIGGASSEITHVQFHPFKILKSISLPCGSVIVSDWILEKTFDHNFSQLFSSFDFSPFKNLPVLAIAGTVTTIAAVNLGLTKFDSQKVNGQTVTLGEVEQLLILAKELKPDEMLKKFPIIGKRIESILGGVLILKEIIKQLNQDEFVVSTYGLRFGSLYKNFFMTDTI